MLSRFKGKYLKTYLKRLSQMEQIVYLEAKLKGSDSELGINKGEYHCVFFSIRELVDKATLDTLGDTGSWALFDVKSLMTLDWLRLKLGSAVVNTGIHQSRGYRLPNNKYYSSGSMHSVACAFDMVFKNYTAEEVRQWLLQRLNMNRWVPSPIRRIEMGVNWFHWDSREFFPIGNGVLQTTEYNKIYFFHP